MLRTGCRKIERLLWSFAARRLTDVEANGVIMHLAQCAVCKRQLEEYRLTITLMEEHRASDIPASLADWHDLEDRLAAHAMSTSIGQRETNALPASATRWRLNVLAFAGMCVALCCIPLFLLKSGHHPTPLSGYHIAQKPIPNRVQEGDAPRHFAQIKPDGDHAETASSMRPLVVRPAIRNRLARITSQRIKHRAIVFWRSHRSVSWIHRRYADATKRQRQLAAVVARSDAMQPPAMVTDVSGVNHIVAVLVMSRIPQQQEATKVPHFVLRSIPMNDASNHNGRVQVASEERQIW